jgi:hypothetical protein
MKHPKDSPMAQPTTAPESIRLTPSEIDALREHFPNARKNAGGIGGCAGEARGGSGGRRT